MKERFYSEDGETVVNPQDDNILWVYVGGHTVIVHADAWPAFRSNYYALVGNGNEPGIYYAAKTVDDARYWYDYVSDIGGAPYYA